jgi:NAD(P)-dependent dehydrogenase (short-subunit alcohol dehydrogenase family)
MANMANPSSPPDASDAVRDLVGRTALVTGAAQGIGYTSALALARAGADVVGLDLLGDGLTALGDEVRPAGSRFLAIVADVADLDAVRRAATTAARWGGGVDVLVNNAAVVGETLPPDVTPEDFDAMFAVNLRGPFFLCQEVARGMLAGDGGSIVNVASVAGEVAASAQVPYEATKAGLLQLTRSLAHVWAPKVRVNSVSPSFVPTELNASFLGQPEVQERVRAGTPLRRVGTRDEVAGAVLYLASPRSSYVTGHNLRVDGGWTIH